MAGFSAGARWVMGEPFAYGADGSGYYADHRNHVLVRTFELADKPEEAELLIAVLGYELCWVNGRRVCDGELLGPWTRYPKLVYYDTFDVSHLLSAGVNEIRIELGNGWYNPSPLRLFGKYDLRERLSEVGTPAALVTLRVGGETVLESDGSWSYEEGQELFNNVYLGERVDLRPTEAIRRPVRSTANMRRLEPNPVPACRRSGEVAPVSTRPCEGGLLVDFGEMVSGFVDLSFDAREGDVVAMTFAESLDASGNPSYDSNLAGLVGLAVPEGFVIEGGPGAPERAIEKDELICAEGANHFVNKFCYHSFRYALVSGLREDANLSVRAIYVHTGLEQVGRLATGNERLDALLGAALRTKLNNVHGTWEDCARERLGYGGDMVALASSNLLSFDCEGLVRKTVRDFANDQTPAGGMPETAPYMGIQTNGTGQGEGPLLWQLAHPYLLVKAYQYYGCTDLVRQEWPHVRVLANHLLELEPEATAACCLGDHGSVLTGESFKTGTPDKRFVGWCSLLWHARLASRCAQILGEDDPYAPRAAELRSRIVGLFGHDDGSFGEGTQTSFAFAGELGLANRDEMARRLAQKVQEDGGVLSTGIFGTMLAFDLLHEGGYDDVAERWLLRDEDPSFAEMLANGSGALAEQFHTHLSSLDHAMFSSYVQWMFQALGGISVAGDAVAANHVEVRPHLSLATNHVEASFASASGMVSVTWTRTGGDAAAAVELVVGAPETVRVDLRAPAGYEVESLSQTAGVRRAVLVRR